MAEKKPLSGSAKLLAAALAGAGLSEGAETLSVDSPIHFAVVGDAPEATPGWTCAPEGGIFGAPMVCRPNAEKNEAEEATDADLPDAGSENPL